MVDVSPLTQENMGYFFRMTLVAPSVKEADIDFVLSEVKELAEEVQASKSDAK